MQGTEPRQPADKTISNTVLRRAGVTEEAAEKIYQCELRRVPRKFTHMRYHSCLMYFGVLKRLGWVETTEEAQPSSIQDNYPQAPSRAYYRLTKEGIEAYEDLCSNPLFALYPEIGPSQMKSPALQMYQATES